MYVYDGFVNVGMVTKGTSENGYITELVGGSELSNVDTGNQTWVFWKEVHAFSNWAISPAPK